MHPQLDQYDPQVIGAKGLVFLGDELLLYRRDGNTDKAPFLVDIPGGAAENKETPYEAFVRELDEEFGLSMKRSDIVYAKLLPATFDPGKIAFFVVVKLPKEAKNHVVLGDEGTEWFTESVEDYLARTDAIPSQQERTRVYLDSKI